MLVFGVLCCCIYYFFVYINSLITAYCDLDRFPALDLRFSFQSVPLIDGSLPSSIMQITFHSIKLAYIFKSGLSAHLPVEILAAAAPSFSILPQLHDFLGNVAITFKGDRQVHAKGMF